MYPTGIEARTKSPGIARSARTDGRAVIRAKIGAPFRPERAAPGCTTPESRQRVPSIDDSGRRARPLLASLSPKSCDGKRQVWLRSTLAPTGPSRRTNISCCRGAALQSFHDMVAHDGNVVLLRCHGGPKESSRDQGKIIGFLREVFSKWSSQSVT